MKLQSLIDQFIAYRQALGEIWLDNCTPRAFGWFMGTEASLEDVKPESVKAFLAGKGALTQTWHIKFSGLRSLYQYAVSRGLVDTNPLSLMSPVRPAAFEPYIYSQAELMILFKAAENVAWARTLYAGDLHLILLLIYSAGLRVSELIRLDRGDVGLEECVLKIRQSKFGKTRLVPFSPQLRDRLSAVEARHNIPEGSTPFSSRLRETGYVTRCRIISGGCAMSAVSPAMVAHDMNHGFTIYAIHLPYTD
ncbi:tyrosine-type recombinase/integrase [Kosakonia sp. S42]|uniref:tyrosine-type recombinase/integrase n=1 Tax=Kosakonia sp. S42 TaxID=2767458 RepID=UPI00190AA317|nr:tyrosine-type recombinase/integrase [Kosakonia sp. S42]MBK0019614.1 tyrosine-type recombinase/integrase [Kosakonia sp. S42]